MKLKKSALALMLTGVGFIGLAGYSSVSLATLFTSKACKNAADEILDEAMCVGRTADSLKGADEDYFRDMDYGITKNPEELAKTLAPFVPGITPEEAAKRVAIGRNNWIVWTAGNDRLWDTMSYRSVGTLDFLKSLSNHPSLKFSRSNRWNYLGLVNEPCFEKPAGPRKDRYGLWLDVRSKDCAPDPFENETKYPGVKYGARGKNIPAGSYYGYATGIVGVRLFPNPDFDAEAEKKWDPERYYTDPSYYNNKDLVRPYRVGMACGFCHVGPNPTNPPADPENPKWENLNSNPGAQYFWINRIFSWDADRSSFPYQLFTTSRPGALDTSLISSDYINNPRTMNAVYNLVPRLLNAQKFGEEKLGDGSLNNKQLNDYVPADSPLAGFYKAPDTVFTPRVLKDGADSVGALGALNRVFINIGLFSEEWLTHFNPLIGGKPITPIPIKQSRKNSSYWQANEAQTPDLALFFIAGTRPDYLKNAPGGDKHLSTDAAVLTRGKEVFGERCARCHSSKLPPKAYSFFPNGGVGKDYLKYWDNYWKWTQTDEFKKAIGEIVKKDDFLQDNFLSTDLRVPVTLLETNACSPLATNAIEGNIWNDFSSQSYKNLPSVGKFTVHHPMTGKPWQFDMPGGGRGFTRPASLVSVWSTAPFLLNNSVGDFNPSPAVEDRLQSFDSSIEQMLWPEKRKGNIQYQTANGKLLPGWIDRTYDTSYLRVPSGYLPTLLNKLAGKIEGGKFAGEQGLELGPIPKGTPVNLLTNIDLDQRTGLWNKLTHGVKLLDVLVTLKHDLKKLPKDATDEQAAKVFANAVEPLVNASKCPDYIVNRGHYFGTDYFKEADKEPGLSDADKKALIAFLKTF
ncbi:hypothetical protein [Methylomicrobium sp. Wu6]|uniref:hypothetical protein n=1 Tax=Methylomicrobium sp. Wu6 TaxID=3107928 RepID=UPI002DD65D39|nr:hypothetical protein [Methylomicrobium sp. Wu6]MEC4750430.1 hypothetical protein [Methylomicrobium sp. Wu6]